MSVKSSSFDETNFVSLGQIFLKERANWPFDPITRINFSTNHDF